MEEVENTWRGQRQREKDRRDMLDQDHLLPLHHLQQQLLDQHSLIRKAMPSQDHLQQQKPHPLAMLVPQV